MEKIININFQGRVIPIEENAYNNLKVYIDGLRNHFAGEESSDEIISDIENRIAELFSDKLKRGAACIVGSDLNEVIDSIGRLEDIEAAEGEENKPPKASTDQPKVNTAIRGRFYRNADDKVIAGVCSGIAARTGIDPIIVRILFVVLIGALFWIYILLWIIVPSQSIQSNITRRLYRNPDDKVIGGVCSGLAVYFKTEAWIMRLIFVFPFVIGIFSHSLLSTWWNWDLSYRFFTGSLGSSLFILYVILWIALPYASSATDRMEMRGEKIDINSIKAASQAKTGAPQSRPQYSGVGRVIGILFKSFFLFIAGIVALSLFGALIGLVFAGYVAIPFTDFLLGGVGQYTMAWAGIGLFLGIPLLAFVTWLVRRLMGVRSHRHYLGYVFAGLWLVGCFSVLVLGGTLARSFSSGAVVEDTYAMSQPSVNKLYINVSNNYSPWSGTHHGRWLIDGNDKDAPFHIVSNDALWLNTIKVNVEQSADSQYHIYETRVSRGNTSEEAKNLASHISFNIAQQDSVITLPAGFTITSKDKFRNQQVIVTVEVPLGKTIQFSKEVDNYSWFSINMGGHRNSYSTRDWDYNIDDKNDYESNSQYIMTASGLKDPLDSLHKNKKNDDDNDSDDNNDN